MLAGDTEKGKILLRDYINATIGFEKLGSIVEKSPKSLMRMFSAKGNPRADNLFSVIKHLQKMTGVHLAVGVGT
jgi:DNA-binding phage protein